MNASPAAGRLIALNTSPPLERTLKAASSKVETSNPPGWSHSNTISNRIIPARSANARPAPAYCERSLFRKSSIRSRDTPPGFAAIARRSRRVNTVTGLLCGAGVLRCGAWPAVRAEDGYFHTAVLLPVVSGLFVVHRLFFSESHHFGAGQKGGLLRHQVGLYRLVPPTA